MGFTSQDDFISEVTQNGKFWRTDWNKITGAAAYTAGRWYDTYGLNGTPMSGIYGEVAFNSTFSGNITGWTPNGTGYSYGANTCVKVSGTGTTLTSDLVNIPLVNGRVYRVAYTITAYTSGTCTVSIGGTSGTARSSAATFIEYITAGAGSSIIFTASVNTAVFTIGSISVVEWGLAGSTYSAAQSITSNNSQGAIYHGGTASPDSKHIINISAVSAVATAVPAVLMLVDVLMVYPYIDANSLAPQTLDNTNTLPRYTDGKGVRAFVVAATTIGAVAHNFQMTYTNQNGTSGKNLPVTVSMTVSAIVPHIGHSGVAANNYGPFLPLAAGDSGIESIQTVQLSAASGTANTFYHVVLCRPLTTIPITTASVLSERDLMNQLPSLPEIKDGAVLDFLYFAGAATGASTNFYGGIEVAWG